MRLPVPAMRSLTGGPGAQEPGHRSANTDARTLSGCCREHGELSAATLSVMRVPVGPQLRKSIPTTTITEEVLL